MWRKIGINFLYRRHYGTFPIVWTCWYRIWSVSSWEKHFVMVAVQVSPISRSALQSKGFVSVGSSFASSTNAKLLKQIRWHVTIVVTRVTHYMNKLTNTNRYALPLHWHRSFLFLGCLFPLASVLLVFADQPKPSATSCDCIFESHFGLCWPKNGHHII